MKLFPNFTSIPCDYQLISWVANYAHNRGVLTCFRPSDIGVRVWDRTIRSNPHNNAQYPEKSCTIMKDLLKYLMKSGILLITEIP